MVRGQGLNSGERRSAVGGTTARQHDGATARQHGGTTARQHDGATAERHAVRCCAVRRCAVRCRAVRRCAVRRPPTAWLALHLLLLAFGCERVPVQLPVRRPARVPRVQATVLVVKTNLLPDRKAYRHLVIIGNGKVRIGNELDQWRLIDVMSNRVTFVDDVSRTYRTESFAALLRQKRAQLRRELPESIPRAQFASTEIQRTFGEFPASLHAIRLGDYQRSLWMSTDLGLSERLFPLMVVSEPLSSPYSPAMADAFEGMLTLRGFPVIDRSDVTYAGEPHVIEKKLERVEGKMVPRAWLELPADYRDLTPRPPARAPSRRRLPRLDSLQ